MNQPDFGKVASAVGVAAGLLVVGAAAGVVAERAVVAKAGRADREADEPFGHLRGTPVAVTDSNGVALHAEIETCTRDNPERPHDRVLPWVRPQRGLLALPAP